MNNSVAVCAGSEDKTTVFYDGDCPVCRFEIDQYQRLDRASNVAWVDISETSDKALPEGKSREALLGAMHVKGADGAWHIGVDGFAETWRALPGFRRVAWIFAVPGVRQVAELAYRLFLIWQRSDRKRREGARRATGAH